MWEDTDDLASELEPERGFEVGVVEQIWASGSMVAGNDPAIWRKDEKGAWIHRLAYRNRNSEFGWEIAESAYTAKGFGIAALRPLQWQNYLDFLVAARTSFITADGLRNSRRLL